MNNVIQLAASAMNFLFMPETETTQTNIGPLLEMVGIRDIASLKRHTVTGAVEAFYYRNQQDFFVRFR